MDISDLPDSSQFKYKWRSPYDFNNTFAVSHIYAISYEGAIKYVGKSTGTKNNYYTGGVIPSRIKTIGIKGVLEFVNKDKLDEREIFWIEKLNPKYNIGKGGRGGLTGDVNPAKRPEVRQKISRANIGKKLSDQHKQKLREAKLKNPVRAHLNKPRDSQTIEKIKKAAYERNKDKYDKIKQLIEQGYYIKEIVKCLGVSSATIAKIKKEMKTKGKHNRKRQ